MFCPNCGRQTPDTARFCPECGAGLTPPEETLSAGGSEAPAGTNEQPVRPDFEAPVFDAPIYGAPGFNYPAAPEAELPVAPKAAPPTEPDVSQGSGLSGVVKTESPAYEAPKYETPGYDPEAQPDYGRQVPTPAAAQNYGYGQQAPTPATPQQQDFGYGQQVPTPVPPQQDYGYGQQVPMPVPPQDYGYGRQVPSPAMPQQGYGYGAPPNGPKKKTGVIIGAASVVVVAAVVLVLFLTGVLGGGGSNGQKDYNKIIELYFEAFKTNKPSDITALMLPELVDALERQGYGREAMPNALDYWCDDYGTGIVSWTVADIDDYDYDELALGFAGLPRGEYQRGIDVKVNVVYADGAEYVFDFDIVLTGSTWYLFTVW